MSNERRQKDQKALLDLYKSCNLAEIDTQKRMIRAIAQMSNTDLTQFGFALRELIREIEKYPKLQETSKHFYNFVTHTRDYYYYTFGRQFVEAGILEQIKTEGKMILADPLLVASMSLDQLPEARATAEEQPTTVDRNLSARERLRKLLLRRKLDSAQASAALSQVSESDINLV